MAVDHRSVAADPIKPWTVRNDIELLEDDQRALNNELRVVKEIFQKAHGSFNAAFWARSNEAGDITVRRMETERKISWRDFPGTKSEWQQTEEAKGLFEQIRPANLLRPLVKQGPSNSMALQAGAGG